MKRITVFIEGKKKRLDLDETLTIDKDNPEILLKLATVYWIYNNVFSSQNETFKMKYVNQSWILDIQHVSKEI